MPACWRVSHQKTCRHAAPPKGGLGVAPRERCICPRRPSFASLAPSKFIALETFSVQPSLRFPKAARVGILTATWAMAQP